MICVEERQSLLKTVLLGQIAIPVAGFHPELEYYCQDYYTTL